MGHLHSRDSRDDPRSPTPTLSVSMEGHRRSQRRIKSRVERVDRHTRVPAQKSVGKNGDICVNWSAIVFGASNGPHFLVTVSGSSKTILVYSPGLMCLAEALCRDASMLLGGDGNGNQDHGAFLARCNFKLPSQVIDTFPHSREADAAVTTVTLECGQRFHRHARTKIPDG